MSDRKKPGADPEVLPEQPAGRTGEGTASIVPHLQKQVQVQLKTSSRPQEKSDGDAAGKEDEPPHAAEA